MVRDDHDRPGIDRRIEGAGGVGGDHDLGPEQAGQPHRRDHLFRPIPLVEVEAAVEDHQTLVPPAPQGHGLPVSHQFVEVEG
jgi:hypothetical protein